MFFDIDKKLKEQIAAKMDDGMSVTYGELVDFCEDIKNIIPERSLVFILCHNHIGALGGYVGSLVNQIVPVLLNVDLDQELMMHLLQTYKPNYIWAPSDYGNKDFFEKSIWNCYGYSLYPYSKDVVDLHPDLALLLTTSGSTGSPKLVRQSYKNIASNAESIVQYLELDQNERPITMLPMNYTYGLSVINSHLMAGATILMTDSSYAQKNFWTFFKEEKATSIVGVPYTYEILKKLRFFNMELPSLRYMTQAGGKLLPELHKEYAEYAQKKNLRFYVMYGQTEATARMSYLPYQLSLEKYGSMGIAIPGGVFRLIDTAGDDIEKPEEVGELVYEGPNVTLGYAETLEDLAKGDERHGILITGDMAKRDSDGYYYIVGRKKRFLKIYGNRVNLDECERLIQSEFPQVECACVGKDDNLKICITGECTEDKMIAFISNKTKLNPKAFTIIRVTEIPKNSAGKKIYSQLMNE